MIAIVYLIFPVYMVLLMIMSANEELPSEFTEKGILRSFLKVAAMLHRKFVSSSHLYMRSRGRRRVQDNLKVLSPGSDIKKSLESYYIRKAGLVLMIIFIGCILATLSSYNNAGSELIPEDRILNRKDYGEGDKKEEVVAFDAEGDIVGEFDVEISERLYTKAEAEKLFSKVREFLPKEILGKNKDLNNVRGDLNLVEKISGYPFEFSWMSDDYDIIHSDGKVFTDSVDEKGTVVMLTCRATYQDMKWEEVFYANVFPREIYRGEALVKNIEKLIKEREESTRCDERFALPDKVDGVPLSYSRKKKDNSMLLLMLMLVCAAAIFIAKDKELTKEVEVRKRQLLLDYPQFVTRLVLYMGAGMSVRGILLKFSDEYKKDKQKGKYSFLYEEVVRSCHELQSGLSELAVYEGFGIRCGLQQYTRLVTLLSQNLKKGNSELLELLKEECSKATAERMAYARKLGEEAGTKLLLPMIMMLLIVMIVIMIPAYLSF